MSVQDTKIELPCHLLEADHRMAKIFDHRPSNSSQSDYPIVLQAARCTCDGADLLLESGLIEIGLGH